MEAALLLLAALLPQQAGLILEDFDTLPPGRLRPHRSGLLQFESDAGRLRVLEGAGLDGTRALVVEGEAAAWTLHLPAGGPWALLRLRARRSGPGPLAWSLGEGGETLPAPGTAWTKIEIPLPPAPGPLRFQARAPAGSVLLLDGLELVAAGPGRYLGATVRPAGRPLLLDGGFHALALLDIRIAGDRDPPVLEGVDLDLVPGRPAASLEALRLRLGPAAGPPAPAPGARRLRLDQPLHPGRNRLLLEVRLRPGALLEDRPALILRSLRFADGARPLARPEAVAGRPARVLGGGRVLALLPDARGGLILLRRAADGSPRLQSLDAQGRALGPDRPPPSGGEAPLLFPAHPLLGLQMLAPGPDGGLRRWIQDEDGGFQPAPTSAPPGLLPAPGRGLVLQDGRLVAPAAGGEALLLSEDGGLSWIRQEWNRDSAGLRLRGLAELQPGDLLLALEGAGGLRFLRGAAPAGPWEEAPGPAGGPWTGSPGLLARADEGGGPVADELLLLASPVRGAGLRLFRSPDLGATWPPAGALLLDPRRPGSAAVCGLQAGVRIAWNPPGGPLLLIGLLPDESRR